MDDGAVHGKENGGVNQFEVMVGNTLCSLVFY
jgi:hypothetical protein